MQDNPDTPDTSRMHDYEAGPGCRPDPEFTMQLAAALVRGVGLAARDGWRAITGRSTPTAATR